MEVQEEIRMTREIDSNSFNELTPSEAIEQLKELVQMKDKRIEQLDQLLKRLKGENLEGLKINELRSLIDVAEISVLKMKRALDKVAYILSLYLLKMLSSL